MAIAWPSDQKQKPWRERVDRAIAKAAAAGKPFTVETLLDGLGILSWAPGRQEAIAYATEMLLLTTDLICVTPTKPKKGKRSR
jgi:hypothetical protein